GEVWAGEGEGERRGPRPADLVAKVRSAGLFRILQPRAFGGLELEPSTVVEIIEELSRADASAGWTVIIGAGSLAFSAWLQPGVARELFGGDADATVATAFAPSGRARADAGARLLVQGRWAVARGSRHAEWFLNGVLVMDGEGPRVLEDGTRDWRLAYIPRSAPRSSTTGTWSACAAPVPMMCRFRLWLCRKSTPSDHFSSCPTR